MPGAASLCLESKREQSSGFKRVGSERRRLRSAGLAAGRRSRPARGQVWPARASTGPSPVHRVILPAPVTARFQLALKPSRAPLAVSSARARVIFSVLINNSARDTPFPV